MAGDRYEFLEDFIATLPRTDTSAPALYFYGKKQTGKGTFAHAVARLWDGPPATGPKVFQKFNSELGRTPIVFCDEGLPKDASNRKPDTTRFRELIEARYHPIEHKHVDPTNLQGCLRMIISENSEEARSLQVEGGYEQYDIAAIEQRIIAIPTQGVLTPDLAQRFAGTDEAAAHFMWIIQQRNGNVQSDRMICRSYAGDLVRRSATQHGRQAVLFAHIAKCLPDPAVQWRTSMNQAEPGVRVLKGAVLANAWGIAEQWHTVGAYTQAPLRSNVSRDLKLITLTDSDGKPVIVKPDQLRGGTRLEYRVVDQAKFFEWAEADGSLPVDELRAAIERNTTGAEGAALAGSASGAERTQTATTPALGAGNLWSWLPDGYAPNGHPEGAQTGR